MNLLITTTTLQLILLGWAVILLGFLIVLGFFLRALLRWTRARQDAAEAARRRSEARR